MTASTPSAIKDRLLRRGARLVDDKEAADTIVAIRSGALSVNDDRTLVGLPGFGVPLPLSGTVNVPEVALFKKEEQQGVAKLAATGYDARTGALIDSTGPQFGFSHKTEWVALLFLTWSTDDLVPGPAPGR
jgi:hypothetical protein